MNGPARREHTDTDTATASAERRVRLTVQYDGAEFAGWQRQAAARTVQGELERVLQRLLGMHVRTAAAGRTDAGVHATGQVVSLALPEKWAAAELARALNALLPFDMGVADARDAAPDFHARYNAVARGYSYRIGTTAAARSPFLRRWCWPLAAPLPVATLDAAAREIIGTHDFAAFAKVGQPERGTVCIVHQAGWRPWGTKGLAFTVVANRFLHHMVRYLVGTMVEVALGSRPAEDISRLLHRAGGLAAGHAGPFAASAQAPHAQGAARIQMSRPAPPEGLFLSRVYYVGDPLIEDSNDEIFS